MNPRRSGSPAHDKVAPIAEITTDFFNRRRVYGPAADIGAVETQPGTDTPTCIRSRPTVEVRQPQAPIIAGAAITLTLTLKNNDPAVCGLTSFELSSNTTGWTGQFDARTLTLGPRSPGNCVARDQQLANGLAGRLQRARAQCQYTRRCPHGKREWSHPGTHRGQL